MKRLFQRLLPNMAAKAKPELTKESARPEQLMVNGNCYQLQYFASGGLCNIARGVNENDEGDQIAVKLVKEQWLNNPSVLEQFHREVAIIRSLKRYVDRPPQLPYFLAQGTTGEIPYYCYQFIEALPLISLLQRPNYFSGDFVRAVSIHVLRQLLLVLKFLSTRPRPVIHGDISTENILFDRYHTIYLLDFGCAYYEDDARHEKFKWVGKPSYISPEQAIGDPWDHRSDIFQVGIVFYELAAQKRWIEGKDAREKILQASTMKEPPSPDFLTDQVGSEVSALVAAMLHPDPEKRLQTAKEGFDRLNRLEGTYSDQLEVDRG